MGCACGTEADVKQPSYAPTILYGMLDVDTIECADDDASSTPSSDHSIVPAPHTTALSTSSDDPTAHKIPSSTSAAVSDSVKDPSPSTTLPPLPPLPANFSLNLQSKSAPRGPRRTTWTADDELELRKFTRACGGGEAYAAWASQPMNIRQFARFAESRRKLEVIETINYYNESWRYYDRHPDQPFMPINDSIEGSDSRLVGVADSPLLGVDGGLGSFTFTSASLEQSRNSIYAMECSASNGPSPTDSFCSSLGRSRSSKSVRFALPEQAATVDRT